MSKERIDPDALKIVRRLNQSGYRSYIVGGAVRDLLLGKDPKDFDIATDARPSRIRKIFRYSRVIGRRFRLVHIYCDDKKVIEVSTFRSRDNDTGNNNIYGTLGEDAFRRDFSFNALFYCPLTEQIIDYVNGFEDILKRRIKVIGTMDDSFREDPVRMIRAIKYASLLKFNLSFGIKRSIRKNRDQLSFCSKERITEEMYKIFESKGSSDIVRLAFQLDLLESLLPSLNRVMKLRNERNHYFARLRDWDGTASISRGKLLVFLWNELADGKILSEPLSFTSIQKSIRAVLDPHIPSGQDVKTAARLIRRGLKNGTENQRSVSIRRRRESTLSP